MQQLFYGKRYSATCLRRNPSCPEQCKGPSKSCPPYSPDFVKFAEAYGATGIRVTKPEEVEDAIAQAKRNKGVTIIEFIIATEELVLPMVKGGSSMSNMILKG